MERDEGDKALRGTRSFSYIMHNNSKWIKGLHTANCSSQGPDSDPSAKGPQTTPEAELWLALLGTA